VNAIIGAVLGFLVGGAAMTAVVLIATGTPIGQLDVYEIFEIVLVAGCPFAALGGILAAASTILKTIHHSETSGRQSQSHLLMARPIGGALAGLVWGSLICVFFFWTMAPREAFSTAFYFGVVKGGVHFAIVGAMLGVISAIFKAVRDNERNRQEHVLEQSFEPDSAQKT
jgi:hypothetical protein